MSDYPDDINNEGYNHSLHHTPPKTVEALREKCIKQRDADICLGKIVNRIGYAMFFAGIAVAIWIILHY